MKPFFPDEISFKDSYVRYFPVLYIHALRMLGDREEAKDVVHDVFASLWRKKAELQIDSSMKAYLYRATRNRVLDLIASRATATKYEKYLEVTMPAGAEDEALREQELMRIIDAEIETLPKQMRTIFQMSRKEEKTYGEIADSLDVSINTVKTQMSRALKKLRLRLAYLFPG